MKNSNSGHLSASTKRTFGLLSISLMNLLEDKPFEKITTIDICKNADVPRATFYNHFEDKYDLLRYTLRSIAEQIKSDIDETKSDREYMTEIILRLLSFCMSNMNFIRKVSSESCSNTLYSETKQLLSSIIAERMTQNILKGRSYPTDIKITAEFYANGIVYTVKSWIENGMTTPKEVLVESLISIMIN